MTRVLSRLVPTVLAILLTSVTYHVVCDLVFQCGCTWIFAGGDAHCDIHDPAPPNCPPCTSLIWGAAFGLALFAAWLYPLILVRRLWAGSLAPARRLK